MPKTYFYQIAIASPMIRTIEGRLPVYHSDAQLEPGQIVSLSYGRKKFLGAVIKPDSKPKFATKPLGVTEFKLKQWQLDAARSVSKFYCANLHQVINLFIPNDLEVKSSTQPDAHSTQKNNLKLKLSDEQNRALNLIEGTDCSTLILQGETGSGKSYLYLKLAEEAIAGGGSAVILTPEISLSPQMIKLFEAHFSVPVFHVSSSLTKAERRKVWKQVYSAKRCVVIGPRSALFLPINNPKLIVIDEFHESTYKNDSAPKYNTQTVASIISKLSGAKLILGSATPRIQDIWLAGKKNVPVIKLKKNSGAEVTVEMIDQNDPAEFIKSKILSKQAIEEIEANLKLKRQTLIFHNQRGTSRALICTECDWVYKCSSCDSRLVFHQTGADKQFFQCHTCARTYPLVSSCANHHQNIKLIGFGTKKIVEEIQRIFPGAAIARIDTDQKDVANQLNLISKNQIQIIVGTQMLAKGHNFKNLNSVIIPLADTGLASPDFTAPEKTYQLLRQVIGRVGRFEHPGKVLVQSYNLNNKIIQLALQSDFEDFYSYELNERRLSLMPPFSFALKVSVIYKNSSTAERKLQDFALSLNQDFKQIRVLGPSPAAQRLVSGKHKVQIIILSNSRADLQRITELLPSNFSFDIDPVNLM